MHRDDNSDDRRLLPYEERLLSELRATVAADARPEHAASRITTRWSLPTMRVRLAAAAAATAAVGLAVGLPVFLGTAPAYSIEKGDDGTVYVSLNDRVDDTKELERGLKTVGVDASIVYIADCEMLSPHGTAAPAPSEGPGKKTVVKAPPEYSMHDGSAPEPGWSLSVDDGSRLQIRADAEPAEKSATDVRKRVGDKVTIVLTEDGRFAHVPSSPSPTTEFRCGPSPSPGPGEEKQAERPTAVAPEPSPTEDAVPGDRLPTEADEPAKEPEKEPADQDGGAE